MANRKRRAPESASSMHGRLIHLIDQADTIKRYDKLLSDVGRGTLDVPAFLMELSRDASLKLAHLMQCGESETTQLQAATEILDRAGYGRVSKRQLQGVVLVDHNASKNELINLILSSARKAGVKTKEGKAPTLEAKPQAETIDVTPGEVANSIGEKLRDARFAPEDPESLKAVEKKP